jgi:hypothetical protein
MGADIYIQWIVFGIADMCIDRFVSHKSSYWELCLGHNDETKQPIVVYVGEMGANISNTLCLESLAYA